MTSGIFTFMFPKKHRLYQELPDGFEPVLELYGPINKLADVLGWPKDWIVCPHCSAHSWRIPPHTFDPCPLIVEMSESAGLKMDAERSTAIRAGVTMERQMEALQQLLASTYEEEEDE